MSSSSLVAEAVFEDEHDAFSASRSEDYVYVPSTPKYFKKLDKHVDSVELDIKLPLVVLGEPGIGKSALLANWMQRRQATMHRDDFLFKHFVGSSPGSCQLSDMLYRLETKLKEHFHLREMDVPETEDRLRWSLSRYLDAAAKKSYPSHIIIVIDGINALKAENSPDGSLHWLPTVLPSNVRFIVSTVVYGVTDTESEDSSSVAGVANTVVTTNTEVLGKNRTFTELQRRKCPELLMEPLGVNVRHRIIDEFIKKYPNQLSLNEKQHFRIVTARASSQPLFLRMLLYALKLGVEMSIISIDDQLDVYLNKHESAQGLISEILDFCEKYVETKNTQDGTETPGILGKVLSAMYVSRNGLSDEEIWGSVELSMGKKLSMNHLDSIMRVLKDVTITVRGLRTFSHEAFRKVVYSKYIQTPEAHIRQHQLMGRYFNRFPPCDRKLDSLAYHLEVSGSWNKLRNALVDVEMFRIWWTASHKKEFIALWASLTNRKDQDAYSKKLVTGEFDEATMRHTQTPRPYYDVVEEYTRSVEEYKETQHPPDEQMGDVVLCIADFLLEFAMLGHEETADVPNFIHPMIPNEDLSSLGVPYLVIDEEGNSVINKPILTANNADDGKPTSSDLPPKPNEETPSISTYFYYRWMWIQFPYVALANCGGKYHAGISIHNGNIMVEKSLGKPVGKEASKGGGKGHKTLDAASHTTPPPHSDQAKEIFLPPTKIPQSLVKIATQPLALLPIRKPTSIRHPIPVGKTQNENDEIAGAMTEMVKDLYKDISQYRYEFDVLVQQRHLHEQKLLDLSNEMTDLTRTYNGSIAILDKYKAVRDRETQASKIFDDIRIHNKNLTGVLLMCQRHPALHLSLVKELEIKVKQDEELVRDIREKLWEQNFESQSYGIDYPKLRAAIQETMMLHHEMLMGRYRMRENVAKTAEANFKMMARGMNREAADVQLVSSHHHHHRRKRSKSGKSHRRNTLSADSRKISIFSEGRMNRWVNATGVIYSKTGISEVGLFFQKFSNCDVLEEQMTEMKKAAEKKMGELKTEQQRIEKELYDMKNSMDVAATTNAANANATAPKPVGQPSVAVDNEADTLEQQMRKTYVEFKRAREKATSAANLEQRAKAGLKHVAEILGIQQTDPNAPVHEVVHQIEAVLDILQEETERHAQQKVAEHGGVASSKSTTKHPSDTLQSRPHELEEAIKSFETPKARIPFRLHNRPGAEEEPGSHTDAEDEEKEGVVSRKDVKVQSQKSIRAEQKKAAKASKVGVVAA